MRQKSHNGNVGEVLFRFKSGTVTAEIRGPRLGWQWRCIDYFRWVQDTREPAKWNKVFPDREGDQIHLEKCVKAVRQWLRNQNRR